MSGRIQSHWQRLAQDEGRALIPFITAGFPRPSSTLPALRGADAAGADFIEIGVPFSDPLADGPAIQHSSQVALDRGIELPWILETVRRFRTESDTPVLLMGYYNPFLQYGVDAFCRHARSAGVDGLIVPDLPPDESGPLQMAARGAAVSMVYLIAPTTTRERVELIGKASTDFCYCVSVTGVTGTRNRVSASTIPYLKRVKRWLRKPTVVGFGIATPAHVRRLGPWTNGLVVGSALVPVLEAGGSGTRLQESIRRRLKPLVHAAHDL
jgi:tryptophan synthase alpha chain